MGLLSESTVMSTPADVSDCQELVLLSGVRPQHLDAQASCEMILEIKPMRAGIPPVGRKGRVRIAKMVAALYSRRSSNTVRSMGRTQPNFRLAGNLEQ